MVKFYENNDILRYKWEQVAQAFWARYPNPYSAHVLSEDVVCRQQRGQLLHSKRLLTKTNRLPKWAEKLVKVRDVLIVEESVVDPVNKTITTYTRNIGHRSIMAIEERCVYRPSTEDSNTTIVDRQAWIFSSFFGFGGAIQAFGLERFKKNVVKTCQGLNYVLEHMFPGQLPLAQNAEASATPAALLDTEKLRERAKKATELAKSKAGPFIAACGNNNTQ